MSSIFDQLRAEHANIAGVLKVLAQQIKLFDQGKHPDFQLMQDIVTYMSEYCDQVHHPKEDVVFDRLSQKDPQSRVVVNRLQSDHKKITSLTKSFADTLEEIVLESVMSREQVSNQAHDFLDTNANHMALEEAEIFPGLLHCFTQDDWQSVSSNITSQIDPLFGDNVEGKYKLLHAAIAKELS